MGESALTAERVRELLIYDPETGIFTRKVRTAQRHQVGDRADFVYMGGTSPGYHRVSIDSERYQAHRVAWLYVHGKWPAQFIDHINGIRSDNRMANLREATAQLNQENLRSPRRKNSASGLLGAQWDEQSGKFRAAIVCGRKRIHLGSFEAAEDAHAAYVIAKRSLHSGCTI